MNNLSRKVIFMGTALLVAGSLATYAGPAQAYGHRSGGVLSAQVTGSGCSSVLKVEGVARVLGQNLANSLVSLSLVKPRGIAVNLGRLSTDSIGRFHIFVKNSVLGSGVYKLSASYKGQRITTAVYKSGVYSQATTKTGPVRLTYGCSGWLTVSGILERQHKVLAGHQVDLNLVSSNGSLISAKTTASSSQGVWSVRLKVPQRLARSYRVVVASDSKRSVLPFNTQPASTEALGSVGLLRAEISISGSRAELLVSGRAQSHGHLLANSRLNLVLRTPTGKMYSLGEIYTDSVGSYSRRLRPRLTTPGIYVATVRSGKNSTSVSFVRK